jgi:hypothetical protein
MQKKIKIFTSYTAVLTKIENLTVLAAHAVCLSTLNPFWGL